MLTKFNREQHPFHIVNPTFGPFTTSLSLWAVLSSVVVILNPETASSIRTELFFLFVFVGFLLPAYKASHRAAWLYGVAITLPEETPIFDFINIDFLNKVDSYLWVAFSLIFIGVFINLAFYLFDFRNSFLGFLGTMIIGFITKPLIGKVDLLLRFTYVGLWLLAIYYSWQLYIDPISFDQEEIESTRYVKLIESSIGGITLLIIVLIVANYIWQDIIQKSLTYKSMVYWLASVIFFYGLLAYYLPIVVYYFVSFIILSAIVSIYLFLAFLIDCNTEKSFGGLWRLFKGVGYETYQIWAATWIGQQIINKTVIARLSFMLLNFSLVGFRFIVGSWFLTLDGRLGILYIVIFTILMDFHYLCTGNLVKITLIPLIILPRLFSIPILFLLIVFGTNINTALAIEQFPKKTGGSFFRRLVRSLGWRRVIQSQTNASFSSRVLPFQDVKEEQEVAASDLPNDTSESITASPSSSGGETFDEWRIRIRFEHNQLRSPIGDNVVNTDHDLPPLVDPEELSPNEIDAILDKIELPIGPSKPPKHEQITSFSNSKQHPDYEFEQRISKQLETDSAFQHILRTFPKSLLVSGVFDSFFADDEEDFTHVAFAMVLQDQSGLIADAINWKRDTNIHEPILGRLVDREFRIAWGTETDYHYSWHDKGLYDLIFETALFKEGPGRVVGHRAHSHFVSDDDAINEGIKYGHWTYDAHPEKIKFFLGSAKYIQALYGKDAPIAFDARILFSRFNSADQGIHPFGFRAIVTNDPTKVTSELNQELSKIGEIRPGLVFSSDKTLGAPRKTIPQYTGISDPIQANRVALFWTAYMHTLFTVRGVAGIRFNRYTAPLSFTGEHFSRAGMALTAAQPLDPSSQKIKNQLNAHIKQIQIDRNSHTKPH